MTASGGYQDIPSIDVENNGVGGSAQTSSTAASVQVTPSSSSPPSLTTKLGYVSLGIILGLILRWRPAASSSASLSIQPNNMQQRFIVNGKSFLDSLPFEDVISPLAGETSILSLSAGAKAIMGSIASSPSSSSPSSPHLLYNAHQSSFGLLYDASNPSNYFVSEYSVDYFLLNSGGFDAQINQAYCSVASVATLLNSLKFAKRFEGTLDLPIDLRYDPYPYATQQDILDGDCVYNTVIETKWNIAGEENVDGIFIPPYGLSLEQSGKLLKCHTSDEWEVTVREVDPSQLTLSQMRYDLKAALIDPDARVMINYDRKSLGQRGGGHFSPLGAYHASTDSFLIVDVAKYKYPPVWVGAGTLFSSMATVDKCGTYDYPKGQERLTGNTSDGKSNQLFNPITPEEYESSLELLNCEQKMRGYIILKKKAANSKG